MAYFFHVNTGILYSVLRLFQDYFSSYETGKSVGGAIRGEPQKIHTPVSRPMSTDRWTRTPRADWLYVWFGMFVHRASLLLFCLTALGLFFSIQVQAPSIPPSKSSSSPVLIPATTTTTTVRRGCLDI